MLQLARWRVFVVIAAAIWAVLFCLPNIIPASVRSALPPFVPRQAVNLGLDLRGGSYILMEIDTRALLKEKLDSESQVMAKELSTAKPQIITTGASVVGDVARIRALAPADQDRAFGLISKLVSPPPSAFGGSPDTSYKVSRAEDGAIEVRMTNAGLEALARDAVDRSMEVIRRRIDPQGTSEVSIARQGADRIIVEAPGASDPEELKRRIGKTAKMTFHMVDSTVTPDQLAAAVQNHVNPPGSEILPTDEPSEPFLAVKSRAEITGDDLKDSSAGYQPQTGEPIVNFTFNSKGAMTFCRLTEEFSGQRFATVLDDRIITAPSINEPICGGNGYIHGHFTIASAKELADLLNAGALPAPLTVVEQRTVGAELGKDAIDAGIKAGLFATAGVVIFMVLAYGLFGAMAILALVINVLMILAAMSMAGATLSLPGIAGLILTVGMAVDANVLIYERMREEQANGRGPALAINAGFNRAVVTIIDSHLTQLAAAVILFIFGHGPVRGFAWTLSIGTITSVFTAVLTTQLFIALWFRAARPKQLPIEGPGVWPLVKLVPKKTHFRFVRFAAVAAIVSVVAVFATFAAISSAGFNEAPTAIYAAAKGGPQDKIGAIFARGFNLGIDFKGGVSMELISPAPIDIGAVRADLSQLNLGDVKMQSFGDPRRARVQFQPTSSNTNAASAVVQNEVQKLIPGVQFSSLEIVGPTVSAELFLSGLFALGLAILLMLFYIWFRFEWQFGLGAVMALFHDTILTLGLFSVFRLDFTLTVIAALLTIIGYSMNDTVVVFDRLRENLRKYKRMSLAEVIDQSTNETLSRTTITSFTALIAAIALLVFGGPTLEGFAIAMIFGIVIGTYSSIYVAAPAILLWGVKRGEGDPGREAAQSRKPSEATG